MSEFMGPPSWWYDPPEGHESECNCDDCHDEHMSSGDFVDLAKDSDFPCCADALEYLLEKGEWCLAHGGAYIDKDHCLECEHEAVMMPLKKAVGE